MKSDGSEQRRLTNNQALNISSLSWSPKGDLIAATIGDPAGGRYSIEIYLMDLNGVIQKQLTTLGINEYPKWSPDGKFIVYHSIGMDNCSGISFMKADGSDQVCLVIDKAFPPVQNINPSWSSDGRYIVFSSNLDGNYDLYMVKADGSGLTQLTNLPGDENVPSWSPLQ
jgi:Tol biopolymer transport system component